MHSKLGKFALARFTCTVALCFSLHAQGDRVISLRLLDGKTGSPVKASNFLVRVDHHDTILNEAVKMNDDGTVIVTIPTDATEVSFKATYNSSMETYINCDAAKQSDRERDIWYPIATILQSGIVAPNECSKTDYKAKPGEFVFFVRKRDWRDRDN
jgi:hypothetical protein